MSNRFEIPAGEYYLSDPCYVVPEADWQEFIVAMGWPQSTTGDWYNYALFKGYHCVAFNTLWGDGLYMSSEGHELPVDAGLIGLVPVEYAEPHVSWGIHRVTFESPILCETNGDGLLTFGRITVDTGDEGEDDDYEDLWGDEEDWDEDLED